MNYWLVKSEPGTYSWADLLKDRRTAWTGVRNYQARINLRAMRRGDLVLFYHSGDRKEVVGVSRVAKTAYPDPTATDGDWSSVDLAALESLPKPVTLTTIKADKLLKEMVLMKNSRLSAQPVTETEFSRVLQLAGSIS